MVHNAVFDLLKLCYEKKTSRATAPRIPTSHESTSLTQVRFNNVKYRQEISALLPFNQQIGVKLCTFVTYFTLSKYIIMQKLLLTLLVLLLSPCAIVAQDASERMVTGNLSFTLRPDPAVNGVAVGVYGDGFFSDVLQVPATATFGGQTYPVRHLSVDPMSQNRNLYYLEYLFLPASLQSMDDSCIVKEPPYYSSYDNGITFCVMSKALLSQSCAGKVIFANKNVRLYIPTGEGVDYTLDASWRSLARQVVEVEDVAMSQDSVMYALLPNGEAVAMRALVTREDYPVLLQETIGNHRVTEVLERAFYDLPYNSSTLPASIRRVAKRAFEEAIPAMGELTIPETCTEIGVGAFQEMKVRKVVLPNSLTDIPDSLFYNTETLQDIIFGNAVTRIGQDAFSDSKDGLSIHLPATMQRIEDGAFEDTRVAFINIPASVTYIGKDIMEDDIATVVKAESTAPKAIGDSIIEGGNYANAVLLVPSGTKELYANTAGWKRFSRIFESDSYVHKDSLHYIVENGEAILLNVNKQWFDALEYVIPSTITANGQAVPVTRIGRYALSDFESPNMSKRIVLPAHLKHIESHALANLDYVDEIVLPEGLLTIAKEAFYDTYPKKLTIPASVQSLGDSILEYRSTETIEVKHTTPLSISETVFPEEFYPECVLIVPPGTRALYASAPGWRRFAHIVESEPTGLSTIKESEAEVVKRYAIDGRPASATQKGIVIERLANGRTQKVVR